jgi:uncharacterized protein (TIGR02466 family)
MNVEDLNLFAEPILKYKFNLNCDEILDVLKNLTYCFRSSDCDSLLDQLPNLNKSLIQACDDWLNDKMKLNVKFEIIEAWATKTKTGGYSSMHRHSHCILSGVFYLKDNNQIKIHKPYVSDFWNMKPTEYTKHNSLSYYVQSNKNEIILFPNYLFHEINKYHGKEDRYSIAFNVLPRGDLGSPTGKITL